MPYSEDRVQQKAQQVATGKILLFLEHLTVGLTLPVYVIGNSRYDVWVKVQTTGSISNNDNSGTISSSNNSSNNGNSGHAGNSNRHIFHTDDLRRFEYLSFSFSTSIASRVEPKHVPRIVISVLP